MSSDSFRPGQVWLDTAGHPIHAHGGKVFVAEDRYYFYGENKEKTVRGSGIWHYGVRMYESADLYNWTDVGLVLKPVEDDPAHPLHPGRIMDRPHIIHNARTGKYVMWVKLVGSTQKPHDWDNQYMGIATADRITGPYELVRTMRPLEMYSGDFNLYVEAHDGKGYIIFERPHTQIVIADLSGDYLDVSGHYSCHFPQPGPPLGREGPTFFKYKHRYYMVTSGTTGYTPNQAEYAVADLIHGPWKVMGDPCVGDSRHTTFDSQFSAVFCPRERPDLVIGVADRWKEGGNTNESTYVWLPIFVDGQRLRITWMPQWRWQDMG